MIKIIVDANYVLHKSFSTFRSFYHKGIFTGTVYGVLRDVFFLAEKYSSNNIHVCWDSRSFRKDISNDYKSTRSIDPKNNPYDSWDDVYNLLGACGIKQYKEEGFEADDIIYTLSRGNEDCVIYTKDRDMFQCLSESTSVLRSLKEEAYTLSSFESEYGFPFSAKDFVFYKSVVGDGSDNIKGIYRFPKSELIAFIKKEKISDKWMEVLIDNHLLLEKNKSIFELHETSCKPVDFQSPNTLQEIRDRLGLYKLFSSNGAKILGLSE